MPAACRPGLATVTGVGRRWGRSPCARACRGPLPGRTGGLPVLFEHRRAQEGLGAHPQALSPPAPPPSSGEGQAGAPGPVVPRSVGPLAAATCWRSARPRRGTRPGSQQRAPRASGSASSLLPRLPAQRGGCRGREPCFSVRAGGAEGESTRGAVTSHPAPCPSPTPRSRKRNKRSRSALSVSPLGFLPPRPAREKTTLPRNPAGRGRRPGSPRPRPPSAAWHHGLCSPRALPAPFPTPGLGGGEDCHSRVPPRRRACALGLEVREAVALRATAEAAKRQ